MDPGPDGARSAHVMFFSAGDARAAAVSEDTIRYQERPLRWALDAEASIVLEQKPSPTLFVGNVPPHVSRKRIEEKLGRAAEIWDVRRGTFMSTKVCQMSADHYAR